MWVARTARTARTAELSLTGPLQGVGVEHGEFHRLHLNEIWVSPQPMEKFMENPMKIGLLVILWWFF